MKACRYPPWLQLRQMGPECCHEPVPSAAIDQSGLSQVAIELSALEEVGQRQLLEHWRAAVRLQLGPRDFVDQVRWERHPSETQAGRQYLARGPQIHHAIGSQS